MGREDDEVGHLETRPRADDRPPPPYPTPTSPSGGDVVGRRWRLERFLDGGGMGAVWEATDLRLDEAAAVKLLNPQLVRTPEARERFLREARAAARLRGPHVVSVLDFDVDEPTQVPYMAMELLRGETLAVRLRSGPLGWLQTRALLRDAGRAMSRAHRLGVVHRDLKPGNVFLATTDEGVVTKVLDFGIAKLADPRPAGSLADPQPAGSLTDTGRTLGTPAYMSPEQVRDASRADHRADIWALGVIVYECLVGQPAFGGSSPVQIIHRICFDRPAPASSRAEVPLGFDAWFDRATERDPERRFGSVDELLEGFEVLEQRGRTAPGPSVPRPSIGSPRSRAWVSDAHQVDIETVEEVVFENAVVREFVHDDRRHFVSGAKGCGKTLLLTVKRARLAARYQAERGAAKVTFIPEGRPFLDLMGDLRTLGRSAIELMSDLSHAKRLWGFALRMSILSHHSGMVLPPSVQASLPPGLRSVAESTAVAPTVALKELLALTVSQIHQVLQHTEMALEHALRSLHSGVYLFIDKIDQALRGVSREAWIRMQAGLIEAAWDLMNANAHVKVFATIREEAFSAYASDIKTNLFGAITRIRYSKEDLRQLLERLTAFYEGIPLRDFVSLDAVRSGRAPTESAFDFIHRHSLGRPRDLVIIASEIARRRGDLDERTFKTIVRDTSAGILVDNVFDEMRVFLEVLDDRPRRMQLLRRIPFGALTRDDLVQVWCDFHGVDRGYFDAHGQGAAEAFHPFRELWDCGLLGLVHDDGDAARQRFKQPHDPVDAFRFDLPRSEVYLLHPSLIALMRQLGLLTGPAGPRDVLIGHDRPWAPHHRLLVQLERELIRIPHGPAADASTIRAVTDLLAEVAEKVERGGELDAVLDAIAQAPGFARLSDRLEALGWDDLHLALLEAFATRTRGEGSGPPSTAT